MIRITIDGNKEVEIKTTKGLEETELAANTVIEIMRNMSQQKPKDEKYDLSVLWVDNLHKLQAIKEIQENLSLGLKDAKDTIDSFFNDNKTVWLTGNKDEVTKAAKKFDSSEYVKVCVSKTLKYGDKSL